MQNNKKHLEEKINDMEVDELIKQVRDVVGSFYKYTLPASLINRKVIK